MKNMMFNDVHDKNANVVVVVVVVVVFFKGCVRTCFLFVFCVVCCF